jgi:hypothetical protein
MEEETFQQLRDSPEDLLLNFNQLMQKKEEDQVNMGTQLTIKYLEIT